MSAAMVTTMITGCGGSGDKKTTEVSEKTTEKKTEEKTTEKEKETKKETETETKKETETEKETKKETETKKGTDKEKKYAKADKKLVYWSMWSSSDPQAEAIQEAVDAYEEASGNTVKIEWKGRNIQKLIQDALDSKKPIDLFDGDYFRIAQSYAASCMDLTEMAEAANYEEHSIESLVKGIKEKAGSLKAIAYQPYTSGIFYNKAIFEEAGIQEEPETWEEFLNVCKRIKEAGYEPLALDDAYVLYNYGYHLARYIGEDAVKELCKNGGWAKSKEALKAAQDMVELIENEYFESGVPGAWPESENTIGYFESAMIVMASWLPNEVKKNTGKDIEWGMFNYPAVKGGKDKKTVINIGAQAFAIPKYSKNAQDAFDLIMTITTGEYDQKIALATNSIPADPTNEEWPKMLAPCKDAFETLTGVYEWNMGLEADADFSKMLKNSTLKLFEGKIDAEAFIKEVDASFSK